VADLVRVPPSLGRRRTGDPIVVFVDSFTWPCFLEFSAAVRRRGVHVERVTSSPRSLRQRGVQRLEGLVFGPTHGIVEGGALHGSRPEVPVDHLSRHLGPDVVDLVVHDDLMLSLLGTVPAPLDPARRLASGVDPAVLVDKRVQARVATDAGVASPRTWDEPELRTASAVVKAPTGFGGFGVRVVDDAPAAVAAYEQLEGLGLGVPFVQEFVEGPSYGVGTVAQDGELVAGAVYLRCPADDNPHGPSVSLQIVDNPDVLEASRAFVRHLGLTGFLNLQFVVGDGGRPLLIDVNPRVFGGWSMLQDLGCDLLGAYLYVLGLGERPLSTTAPVGARSDQLRMSAPIAPAERGAWRSANRAVLRRRRGQLGLRWEAVVRLKLLAA
jgi:hypothetical protein